MFLWKRDRLPIQVFLGFPGGSDSKQSACNVGDMGLIPGLGRSFGRGHGNPLLYSCLENPHGQRSLAGYSPWARQESKWLSDWAQHRTYKGSLEKKSILKSTVRVESRKYSFIFLILDFYFPGGSVVKNTPHLPKQKTQEMHVQSLSWEHPLE